MLSASHALESNGSGSRAIAGLVRKLLIEPSTELRSRPSHRFRSRLVEIGASLAGAGSIASPKNLAVCSEAIESLHLGSLIVDDIQDGSLVRRDGDALHAKLGVPHALSVGNWLYFHAMKELSNLEIEDSILLRLQKEWLTSIEWAHYGQVMDLATSVKDLALHEIADVCHYTALYKTGCISGLAIAMGAMVAGADEARTAAVRELGCALGVYLQQLNDIGNILGSFDPEKRYEDLYSLKPTFIWSLVLNQYGPEAYHRLMVACRELPCDKLLLTWLDTHPLRKVAYDVADHSFHKVMQSFLQDYPDADITAIFALKDRIQKAYA
jgi:geranylgeranyl pyrophosphate synthase